MIESMLIGFLVVALGPMLPGGMVMVTSWVPFVTAADLRLLMLWKTSHPPVPGVATGPNDSLPSKVTRMSPLLFSLPYVTVKS